LVELMVVIGIIGLLVALVLPAVGAARRAARAATTAAMISVLETGAEAFRADSQVGGSLPPSNTPLSTPSRYQYGEIRSPHTGKAIEATARTQIPGASLLVWALAGADLMGTPGFRSIDGSASWADATGNDYDDDAEGPRLYLLDGNNRPAVTRSGPYVDTSKMRFPTWKPTEAKWFFPDLRTSQGLDSLCFLDSFGQPIVYYRANPSAINPWSDSAGDGSRAGVYNIDDNACITGGTVEEVPSRAGFTNPGIDLLSNGDGGALLNSPYGSFYHYLPGPNGSPDDLSARSLAYLTRDPSAVATPRPHRPDSFILISAGPDGIFGSADDIANFKVNQ